MIKCSNCNHKTDDIAGSLKYNANQQKYQGAHTQHKIWKPVTMVMKIKYFIENTLLEYEKRYLTVLVENH